MNYMNSVKIIYNMDLDSFNGETIKMGRIHLQRENYMNVWSLVLSSWLRNKINFEENNINIHRLVFAGSSWRAR